MILQQPLTANNRPARGRRNRPECMQHFLKSLPGTARAAVVAAELLDQLLLAAMDEAQPALDARLAWEALTPLGRPLESRAGRRDRRCVSWSPPLAWGRRG